MPKTATREVGADGRAGFRIHFSGDLAGLWAAYEFGIYERIAASAERFSDIAVVARSTVMQTKAVPAVRDLREDEASYWIEDAGKSLFDAYHDAVAAKDSLSFVNSPTAYVELLDAALQRYRVLHMAGVVHLDVAFRNIVCPISADGTLLLRDLRIIDFCDAVVHLDGVIDGSAPHLVPPAPRFAGRAARPERNDDNLCRAIDALRAQSRDDLLNRLSVHVDLASLFATFRADLFEEVFAAGGVAFRKAFDAMRSFLIDAIKDQHRSHEEADDALMAFLLPSGMRQATADMDHLYLHLGRHIDELRRFARAAASMSPEPSPEEASKGTPNAGPPHTGPHATLRSVTPDSMSAVGLDSATVQPAPTAGAERNAGRWHGTTSADAEPTATATGNATPRTGGARPVSAPSRSSEDRPTSPRSHRVRTVAGLAVAASALAAALWFWVPIVASLPSGSAGSAASDDTAPIPGVQAPVAVVARPAPPHLRITPGAAIYRAGNPLTFTVDSDTPCLLQVTAVDAQGSSQRLVPLNPGDEAFLLPGDRYQQQFPDSASDMFTVRMSPGLASLRASCSGDQGTETAEARIQIAP